MYDRREKNNARLAKGEKLRPDWKCRDKNCDGVIWRPKDSAAPRAAAPAAKQAYSSGPALPYENQETGAPPSAMPRAARDEPTKLDGVLSLHDVCVMHSAKRTKELLMQQGLIPTAADILAAAATQMIAAQKVGATP